MALERLTTDGRSRIVRASDGDPVRLLGVNRSGLEYAAAGCDGMTEAEVAGTIAGEWRANVIRLPFNQDWVLRRAGYLERLDEVIGWASAAGAYVLLDLQWINTEVKIAPLPDFESPGVWRVLAERYRANPAVLFDLYNEPHDVKAVDWVYWATLLTDTIRAVHPEALVFVSGVDWGYDLRGVRLDREHVVYSTHVYPNKTKRLRRERAFGFLAGEAPLFAGEWGGWDDDVDWGVEQARYFDELEMGWAAWSWSDKPHLMINGEATLFGRLVNRLLVARATVHQPLPNQTRIS